MRNVKKVFSIGLLAMLIPMVALSQEQKSATARLQVTQCALKVSGMTCGGCAGMVEKGLLKVEGVKTAKVDFKTGEAQVGFDKTKTTPEKIVAAFNQANGGFRVQQAKAVAK